MGADIDHRHPEVSNDLLAWATWIVKELGDGVAGFRFDAVKVNTSLVSCIVTDLYDDLSFAAYRTRLHLQDCSTRPRKLQERQSVRSWRVLEELGE